MTSTTGGISSTSDSQIAALVQNYLQLERLPLTRLETNRSILDQQLAAFQELKEHLRDLRTALDPFRWTGALTPLNCFQASSSQEGVLTATVSGSAAEGSHTITVQSLARAHSVGSAAFAGDAIATVSGTHGFQITAAGKTA
ncbi:MAG: flagellar cap protein FliD N-terminal domain-containing protein, partial [Candidatus Eisenbacteria bacterium]